MPSVTDIERLCFLTEHTAQAGMHEGVCVESLAPNIKNKIWLMCKKKQGLSVYKEMQLWT